MWKKVISILLLVSLSLQTAIFAENDAQQVICDENFEKCMIDRVPSERWVETKNSTDRIGAVMYRDTKVLKISKGASGKEGNTGVKLYPENSGAGTAVISARVMAASEKINFAPMYVLDEEGKSLVCCIFDNKGRIGVFYNNTWNYNVDYQVGQWYDLRAEVDLNAHKFDFYVNETKVAENANTRSNGRRAAVINSYITTVNTVGYIDKISFSAVELGEAAELPETDGDRTQSLIDFSENVTVFKDDFEDYAVGGFPEEKGNWKISSNGGGSTEIVEIEGNKAVRIHKPPSSVKGEQTLEYIADTASARAFGNSIVTIEYKIKSNNSKKFIGGPYIMSRTVTPGVTLGFGTQGYAYVNSQTQGIGNYIQEKWYSIRLVLDYPNKVFDVYVNGELARANESYRSINCMDLKTIKFYVEVEEADCYIDDFKITASNKDMPSPANEALPPEKYREGDTTVYKITDEYVERRMSVLPPVLAEIEGRGEEKIIIKSDAAARLAKYKQPFTIYGDRVRIKLPETVMSELDTGEDITIEFNSEADPNEVWRQISDNAGLANTGVAVKLRLYAGNKPIEQLSDAVTVKLSERISGGRDNKLVVMRGADDCSETLVSKHDDVSEGIMFRTTRFGDFIAVRSGNSFDDVPEDHWAKEDIDAAAARKIIVGCGGSSFMPEEDITRGDAAVMISRAIGINPAEYDDMFEDIDGSEYFAPSIAALYLGGILDREITGDAFRPHSSAERSDIAYMAMSAYYYITGRKNEELTKFYTDGTYPDIGGLDKRIADYIKAAYVIGVMNGDENGFRPNDAVTRAETAKIIVNLLEAVGYINCSPDLKDSGITDIYTFPSTYKSYHTYISKASLAKMNENGAFGENIKYEAGEKNSWFIEEQRGIDDDIVTEIVRKRYLGEGSGDAGLVESLMKSIEWGFSKQDETGGFDGSGDEYHSAGFFIEETARILLLMKESGDSSYERYLNEFLPKLEKAAEWLARDEEFEPFYDKGYFDIYTHRYFYYGTALLYVYRLTGNTVARDKARFLLLEGISRMTKEGILPEKYGFDVGYGVVSIICVARAILVCDDPMIRSELMEVLTRSSQYIINKIDNKGNIDLSDSTRTGGQETKRDGVTVKTVSERSTYNTLLAASAITGLNDLVLARDQMSVRQSYLAPAYMQYRGSGYDYAKERFDAPMAQPTENSNLRLTELPVKAVKVSQEYGNDSNPEAMFTQDESTGGWYARKFPQYADIDLGTVKEIGKVDIVFGDTNKRTYTYSIMLSDDGENWKYAAMDIKTKRVNRNTVEFDYAPARYVRIWVQQAEPLLQSEWFTDIRKVRVFGVDRGGAAGFEPLNKDYAQSIEF